MRDDWAACPSGRLALEAGVRTRAAAAGRRDAGSTPKAPRKRIPSASLSRHFCRPDLRSPGRPWKRPSRIRHRIIPRAHRARPVPRAYRHACRVLAHVLLAAHTFAASSVVSKTARSGHRPGPRDGPSCDSPGATGGALRQDRSGTSPSHVGAVHAPTRPDAPGFPPYSDWGFSCYLALAGVDTAVAVR